MKKNIGQNLILSVLIAGLLFFFAFPAVTIPPPPKFSGLFSDGSETAPSLAFTNSTGTGLYQASDQLRFSNAGTLGFIMLNGGFQSKYSVYMQDNAGFYSLGVDADIRLYRDAANTLALKNGNADQHYRIYGANGTYRDEGTVSELLTINAAATTDTTMTIPANAVVFGVSVRVTVVIPTAATFTVTGATSATAFQTGASVSTAANTTDAGTKACPYLNTVAQSIRITPNLTPADNTGRVRVTIHYYFIQPSTS